MVWAAVGGSADEGSGFATRGCRCRWQSSSASPHKGQGELRETYTASRSRNHLSRSAGVPQETAPQVWLVDPWSPGLARLLAAVLAGGPQGEERGAGEEEEGRAGEGAG